MKCGVGGVWFFLRGLVLSLTSLVLMPLGVMNFPHGISVDRPPRPGTLLLSYFVRSDIHYRYATTLVSSQVVNPTDWRLRVNFTVILPENAYISSFVMEVGGQLYETTVTERMKPDVDFADGRLNEIEAVRLRDSNVFRASVCLAGGGTEARFYLTYEELLQRRMGAYHHVINLHPGQVAQKMLVEVFIREGRHITALRVPSLRSGHEIDTNTSNTDDSPLVNVTQLKPTEASVMFDPTPEEQQQWRGQWKRTKFQREKMALREGSSFEEWGLEGQLVILYDVARDPYSSPVSGGELVVKDGYFVHFFSPANLPQFNRHLVFVLDVSKSMSGRKIKQLKIALMEILVSLKKTEYFSIIKFNNKKSVWNPFSKESRAKEIGSGRVVPATPKYLVKAKKYLKKLRTSGGTKTLRGLMKGLAVARESRGLGGNHPVFPMIVLVTDGETDTQKTGDEAGAGNLAGHWEIPIFCLGYVPDSDMPLLRAISRRSAGGWARRVYDSSDANLQISELHAEAAWPVLGGVRFAYSNSIDGLQVDPSSLTQTRFYSANSGSELVVAGKLIGNYEEAIRMYSSHKLDTEVVDNPDSIGTLSGYVSALSARGRARFPFKSTIAGSSFPIERLWAYLMVNQLTTLEAAKKAWGMFWSEKNLNGGDSLEMKEENINGAHGKNKNHNGTINAKNKSSVVISAKMMAKQYSFVSPGMILMFAELKDDQYIPREAAYQLSSDYGSFEWAAEKRQRKQNVDGMNGKARVAAGKGRGASQRLGRMRFDDNRGRGCNAQTEGMFWSPLPHELKPSSLCSIGIDNFSCSLGSSEDNGHSEKYPLVRSPDDLIWMKDVKMGSVLVLPKGHRGSERVFELGFGQEDRQFAKCVTPSGVPGHCRHLQYCLLKEFATDYNYFLRFFCNIESSSSYVGVCCPDYLYKNKRHHGS